jgi:hypothetical protein
VGRRGGFDHFAHKQRAQAPEGEACMTWMSFYRSAVIGALALPALLATIPASAQTDPAANYPIRPIRVIVGFAAGGGNDIFARLVGQKLSDRGGGLSESSLPPDQELHSAVDDRELSSDHVGAGEQSVEIRGRAGGLGKAASR